MILPGNLPLSVIRGITFDAVDLQFSDGNVVVSGTLSPNVTGVFVPNGKYNGSQLYILAGSPSTFLYVNPTANKYVIARLLTNGALTDYWSKDDTNVDDPSGTYTAHGANTGAATAADNPRNLTGMTPEAVVRRNVQSDVLLDLNPSVLGDPVNGRIRIPAISAADTRDFDFPGTSRWDLVLAANTGERSGPYVQGPFTVTDNQTQMAG